MTTTLAERLAQAEDARLWTMNVEELGRLWDRHCRRAVELYERATKPSSTEKLSFRELMERHEQHAARMNRIAYIAESKRRRAERSAS